MRNRAPAAAVALIGVSFAVAMVAVFAAFWSQRSIAGERIARSQQLNVYLEKQCHRDRTKDAVFIGILQDSIASVRRRRDLDPALVASYVRKQTENIAAILDVDRQCVDDIPPPIPNR